VSSVDVTGVVSRNRGRAIFWLVALIGLWTAAAAARGALGVSHGLQAEFFDNDARAGAPAATRRASPISTAAIAGAWDAAPPSVFSARWYGYLAIGRPGSYTFAVTSDDGSTLRVDGALVVDNGGAHSAATRSGQVWLGRGPHFVTLEYFQAGGAYELAWAWARDGGALSPVPGWVLTPTRFSYRRVLLARVLDSIATSALALVALAAVWAAYERRHGRSAQAVGRHARAASLALFVALAILQTWPLATDPGHLSRNDNGDAVLNEWVLSWVAHQAVRDPLHLYDANIFHPERYTLTYSEAMIVQSAMGAPLRWLGASPVLTYNLVLLAGLVLTGWTMSLVMARWTGSWTAGLTSGIIAAFNAHTLTRLPHLQAQHTEFVPLALLALDALLRDPRAGHAVRLAVWFTLEALTSVYMLVFTTFAMTIAAMARPEAWWGRRIWKLAPRVALAAGVAGLALLPFLLPYWIVYDQGLSRSLADARQYSASWTDYLTTPSRFHYPWWSHLVASGNGLFPGAVALLLAGVAIASGAALKDARARMCLAIGLGGLVLSFGPKVPGYATLYELVPLLHSIRAPARFGYLVVVAAALLAGFGLVELRRWMPSRARTPISVVVLVLATLDPLAAPLRLVRFNGIPAIYQELRGEPDAVVAELPLPAPRSFFQNANYMLNSTAHWKPMLNGYSGFLPLSYRKHVELAGGFPQPESIAALRAIGVTHVFVHLDQFRSLTVEDLDRIGELSRIAVEGPIALYRIE